jgi:phosphatidylserine/phosphatidylglycerophosphate/cardiolipin synthase-like enzyme
MRRRLRRILLLFIAAAWAATALWHTQKALPPGTQLASANCVVPAEALGFIADVSAADAYGRPAVSQAIFDSVLAAVRGARRFIVLDYHRIGAGGAATPQRPLGRELTDALLAQRHTYPGLAVLFITDPVNEAHGASESEELALLRAAGVAVVSTDLDALRDPNSLYTSLWRLTLRWWAAPASPLGSASRRLNFKADHRKVLIADDGQGGLTGIIGSANPFDPQSRWSNLAGRVSGGPLGALLASELAVARFSGWRGAQEPFRAAAPDVARCQDVNQGSPLTTSLARVQLLTEGAIRAALLAELAGAARGDVVEIAAFQIADRAVVQALLDAARRGVSVRLILDPSEDRTTLAPSGLPNQPVASELVARSGGAIQVRWYRTHGERFHGSLALVASPARVWLTLGSANFTRRSLGDYNLEANVALELTADSPTAAQVRGYFEQLWSNRAGAGIEYTADFAVFANPSQADYWLGRLLEATGLSDF